MNIKLDTINRFLAKLDLLLVIEHEGDHQADGSFRFKEDGFTTISLCRRASFFAAARRRPLPQDKVLN
jgi:hypothetical protein